MKFKFLQLIVLIAGCAGLLCICFPEWISAEPVANTKTTYKSSDVFFRSSYPVDIDSAVVHTDSLIAI